MKQDSQNSTLTFKKLTALFLVSLILISSFLFPAVMLYAQNSANSSNYLKRPTDSTTTDSNNPWLLDKESKFPNYLILDTELQTNLYSKASDELADDALALNIITVLLGLEKFDVDSKVTISKEIADISASENISSISLETGMQYSIDFLNKAILYYDSNAALLALISNLAKSEAEFVDLATARLRNLGMSHSNVEYDYARKSFSLNTNLNDLALLLTNAYSKNDFQKIFQSKNEVYLTESGQGLLFNNRMAQAWSLSGDKTEVQGALIAGHKGIATVIYRFAGPNYSIYILQRFNYDNNISSREFDTLVREAIAEAFSLESDIENYFQKTVLFKRGDIFKTVSLDNGVEVSLVYENTVEYLKPVSVSDTNYDLSVQLLSDTSLPIEKGENLGQITVFLPNGEIHSSGVAAAEDIYSQNNFVETVLTTLTANENVVKLIIVLLIVLLVIIIIEIVLVIVRYYILNQNKNLKK